MVTMTDQEKAVARAHANYRRMKLDHKHEVEKIKENIKILLGFALIGLMIFTILILNAWING